MQVLEEVERHALALLRLVPLMNVGQRDEHAGGLVGSVALGHQQGGLEPAPATRFGQADLELAAAAGAGLHGLHGRGQARLVVAVELHHPGGRVPAPGAEVRQGAPGGRSEPRAGGKVPVGHAQPRAVERPLPALRLTRPGHRGSVRAEQCRHAGDAPDEQRRAQLGAQGVAQRLVVQRRGRHQHAEQRGAGGEREVSTQRQAGGQQRHGEHGEQLQRRPHLRQGPEARQRA